MRQPDLSRVFRQITAIAVALGIIFMFVSLWVLFGRPSESTLWGVYGGVTVVISGMALFLARLRWPPLVTGHADWSDHFAETSGGEYCVVCKMPRLNHAHVWDECRCRTCPEIREEGHVWVGCRCQKCQSTRAVGHDPAACGVCKICHNPTVGMVRHDFEDLTDDAREFEGVRQVAQRLGIDEIVVHKKCKHCDLVMFFGD